MPVSLTNTKQLMVANVYSPFFSFQKLISCFPRYIPIFWNSLDPASLPQQGGQRGEGGGRREGIWDSLLLREIFISKKIRPHPTRSPTTPSPRSSICRRLSFKIKPFKKTETFERRRRRKPEAFFPFLKSRFASSQLVFKLSLVKTISPIPRCPKLSKDEREGTF